MHAPAPKGAGLSQLGPSRLPLQIARAFPGWNEVGSPIWSGRFSVPRFGSRPLEDVQHAFQTLAGLYGPRFLTSERANPARQRYPEYVGGVDRGVWLTRKLGQLGASFYREKPAFLELLETLPATLTDLRRADQLELWAVIAGFLNGERPSLAMDQPDADLLSSELEELATRGDVAQRGVSIRQFKVQGSVWGFDVPTGASGRRIASWKVLGDELKARGLRELRDEARSSGSGGPGLADPDHDAEDDGAPGDDWDQDADGTPGDDPDGRDV
jgi:hypothetical protein